MARRRTWLLAALLPVAMALPWKVTAMDAVLTDKLARLLRLPDAAYFDFDEAAQLKLQAAMLALQDPDHPGPGALALGAPSQATQGLSPSVPVLVGSVRNARRDWQVNFAPNLQLLVRHQATGQLHLLSPAVSMRRGLRPLPSGAGPAPGPAHAADSTATVQKVDLYERLGQALAPGAYRVTALVHDWASNTAALQVGSPRTAPAPLQVQAHPGVQAAADARAQMPTTVQLPAEAGPGRPALLKLALQLGAEAGVQGNDRHAVWAGHVLLLPLDGAAQVLSLRLPLQRAQGSEPARYNLLCQVDLQQALPDLPAGAYQVYVETGAQVLGPYPLHLRH